MCRNTSLKTFSVPKPPHLLTQGTNKNSCHLCSLNASTVYLPKEIICQRSNMCQCHQYAMEREKHIAVSVYRIRKEICISGSQHFAYRILLLQKCLQV